MLSASYSELFSADLLAAREICLNEMGHDFTLSPVFWENWVAQVTGGMVTSHKAEFDVLAVGWRNFNFEVKFSRAFNSKFDNGVRRVFKWSRTIPQIERAAQPDAIVLIGADGGEVWAWASTSDGIARSTTITVPCARVGGRNGSRFDALEVPPADLLPALMRICHLTYDAAHHAKNAAETRRKRRAAGDLFGGLA